MGNCCLSSSHRKSPAGAGVWKAVLKSRSENLTRGLLCCPLQEGGHIPEEGDPSAQLEELQEGLLFMWRKNKIARVIKQPWYGGEKKQSLLPVLSKHVA